jgi:hypothetical protein
MPSGFFSALRQVPEFARLSERDLPLLDRLVEIVDLPPGTVLGRNAHEAVITMAPAHVLVVGRRMWPTIRELATRGFAEQELATPRHGSTTPE